MDLDLLHDLINRINTGIIVVDADTNIIHWNRWVSKASRISSDKVLDQPLIDTLSLATNNPIISLIHKTLTQGMSSVLSNTLHKNPLPLYQDSGASNQLVEQQITLLPIRTSQQVKHCLIHIQDMSEACTRDSLLQKNSQKLKKLSLAVEHSPTSVVITNIEQIIEYVNPKFTTLTGYLAQEAIGQPLSQLCADQTSNQTEQPQYQERWAQLLNGKEWCGEVRNRRRDGRRYWAQEHIAPILNNNGDVTHFVVIQEDVTEVRQFTDQISYQASHDLLTGLINRREFESQLKLAITNAQQDLNTYVLFFLDLDQFKVVNDTCGHVAGDELLRQISSLLQQFVSVDSLARLGGDEFVMLIEDIEVQQAQDMAQDIIDLIESFRFYWQDYIFSVGVSIGLTHIDINSANYIGVLNEADSACYAAKDNSRNSFKTYQHNNETFLRRKDDTNWANEISEALDQNRFVLFAQEIVPLKSTANSSYEVLLRMVSTRGELISPACFLPAAERYNLAIRIDRWVINNTLQWISENYQKISHIDHISINLSGKSLGNTALLTHIISQLKKLKIPPHKIYFEITETAAITNLSAAKVFIKSLRQFGCKFALDDFGSGLSSFGYLKNLTVDVLKIDGMFVKDILADQIDESMVRSINDIGHILGLETIAEFVENIEIANHLKSIGVDYAQGYAFSRPMPIDDILVRSVQEQPEKVSG